MASVHRINLLKMTLIWILFGIMLALPNFSSGYVLSFFSLMFMYATLAQSWNIMSGLTGYWSNGHHAFFGIAAYTLAILIVKFNYDVTYAFLFAIFSSTVLAVIIGALLLRIRGPYFVIGTLVIAEMIKVVIISQEWLTGGGNGLLLPPRYFLFEFYYLMLTMVLLVSIAAYKIKNSKLGYAFLAIKDDEDAAEAMGINVTKYKIVAFLISGFFTGICGCMWALYVNFIDPYSAFDPTLQLIMAVSAAFGGLGTIIGPLLGTIIYVSLLELLWVSFPYFYFIILGLSLAIIIRFLPQGVLNYITTRLRVKKPEVTRNVWYKPDSNSRQLS